MMIVAQLDHEKATLLRRFSAFQKSREGCNEAFSHYVSQFVAYATSNLFLSLLSNMNKRLQAICFQVSNSFLRYVLDQPFVISSKKWGLIIYDFTRENRLMPTVNSLFLSPLILLTVRGTFNLSSTSFGSRDHLH